MRRCISLFLLLILLLPALCGCQSEKKALYNESYTDLFDTACTFYGATETAEDFLAVSFLVKEELERLDALFDGYEEKSEHGIFAVNAAAGMTPVRVEEDVMTLLELALDFYDLTDGALSPTMGAVTSLWKKAIEAEVLPDEDALTEAGRHIDPSVLEINRLAGTVYLSDPEASIDLGAFVKGYAADQVMQLLSERGCENFLLDLGGNIYAKGNDPKTGLPFLVGVEHPNDATRTLPSTYISSGALVTSGGDKRGFQYEGKNYHHIISPETLYPAESGLASVSVLHSSATSADALSTALFLLGEEKGQALLQVLGGEALFVQSSGEYSETPGFSAKKKNDGDTAVFIFLAVLLAAALGLYFYRNSSGKKKEKENDREAPQQNPTNRRMFSKKDVVFFVGTGVILIICFLTVACFDLLEEASPEAVVRQNGEVICRLPLSENQLYRAETEDGYNIIAVHRGEVCIYASDCPNGCCMKSGAINSMSMPSVLVCLPHRLTVSIESSTDRSD